MTASCVCVASVCIDPLFVQITISESETRIMGPDDTEDNFSFPLIEMLDQVFEETLEEVKNHNKTLTEEVDLQVASHVKVVFTMS